MKVLHAIPEFEALVRRAFYANGSIGDLHDAATNICARYETILTSDPSPGYARTLVTELDSGAIRIKIYHIQHSHTFYL